MAAAPAVCQTTRASSSTAHDGHQRQQRADLGAPRSTAAPCRARSILAPTCSCARRSAIRSAASTSPARASRIIDPANVTQVNNQPMTAQGAPATCNSHHARHLYFPVPVRRAGIARRSASGPFASPAIEGVEGTVTDLGIGRFTVVIPQPSLTILKTSTVLSDPVNNTTQSETHSARGGAVRRHRHQQRTRHRGLRHAGDHRSDSGRCVDVRVDDARAIRWCSSDGAPASGLTYNYATHVTYSSVGVSGPWTYTPVPDANGFDPLVRAVRISPAGVMSAAGGGNPSLSPSSSGSGSTRSGPVAPDRSDFGARAPILGCHFSDGLSERPICALSRRFRPGRVGTQIALSSSSAECSPPPS